MVCSASLTEEFAFLVIAPSCWNFVGGYESLLSLVTNRNLVYFTLDEYIGSLLPVREI
jgi:hypothetical protein